MILRVLLLTLIFTVTAQAQQPRPTTADPEFRKFVAELRKDAQAKGITRQTFNLAFAGVTPDPRVIALTTRQPEQAKPMGAYVYPASGQRSGGFERRPNGEACSTPRRSASRSSAGSSWRSGEWKLPRNGTRPFPGLPRIRQVSR